VLWHDFVRHPNESTKMTKPPKPPKEERWQTHVYLSPADFKRLAEIAERESRSVTGQIQYYIRQGLDAAEKAI
jgi:hypothetical protein